MERRKPVVKDHPSTHSPSPEAPSEDSRLQAIVRSSRATSEARSGIDEPTVDTAAVGDGSLSRFSSTSRASVARDDGDEDVYGCSHTPERGGGGAGGGGYYRSSRAGSEAPQRGAYVNNGNVSNTPSPGKRVPPAGYGSARSSRAGSEAPDRDIVCLDSQRSSRGGSEAPQRFYDPVTPEGAKPSRSASVAAGGGVSDAPGAVGSATKMQEPTPMKKHKSTKQPKTDAAVASTGPNRTASTARQVMRYYGSPTMPAEHIRDVERYIYHTVRRSTGVFEYYQLLHYPLEPAPSSTLSTVAADEAVTSHLLAMEGISIDRPVADEGSGLGTHRTSLGASSSGGSSTGSAKEPSPIPRGPSSSDGGGSAGAPGIAGPAQALLLAPSKEDSDSPSPHFDESAFNSTFDAPDFLHQAGANLEGSFSVPLHVDEATQHSVSVLAMMTLPDPVSGAPVLGLCLGDYNGHVEYFEVSSSESSNRKIRKSKSLARSGRYSGSVLGKAKGSLCAESVSESIDSEATVNIMHDMRGREVARRHSHKAFVKSINALTSVAVEPCVKCLTFVRPHSSPSVISYLTANERVIKLFHVRREGFTPFSAFPYMEDVVGHTFVGSRYFARLPAPTSILPIKEYGPSASSIQALSVSADNETFLSVEDLQVFWWSFEAADTTRATCVADLRPPSGALDEVEELVTAASFHPTHSSLFMMSRSSGILNIGDLRDPPSREQRLYAITTQVTPQQNPTTCAAYDEILCSISAAAFLSPDHVVTRDYLSLKLWDLRKPDIPYAMTPVMNYVARYLDPLYENDSIFDRFPVAVDDVSGTVVTGLYDGAVAVWQPLSSSLAQEDVLVHYRADPFVAPTDGSNGGRVTVPELEESLAGAWRQHGAAAGCVGDLNADAMSSGRPIDGLECGSPDGGGEEIPEPFTNKVLNVAVAPGGERFGYTYKNGRLVYVFERKAGGKHSLLAAPTSAAAV